MARADLDSWAQIFAADLGSDGAWVPFDRAVFRHRQNLEGFLARGLTYSSLAGAIDRAGGRRPDGRSYTDKQLNTALRRAKRYAERSHPASVPVSSPETKRPKAAVEPVSARAPRGSAPPSSGGTSTALDPPATNLTPTSNLDQDLSDEDIRAALVRIRRADP